MSIKRSNYDGLDWIEALKARVQKRDYETRYASVNEADAIDNALEQTIEAAFRVPTSEETSQEAISRASKEAADSKYDAEIKAAIKTIKDKLSNRDEPIDPVSLGVEMRFANRDGSFETRAITKEDWDNTSDVSWTDKVARLAVLKFHEAKKRGWESGALKAQASSKTFDPQFTRDGRIMSAPAAGDDIAPRFGRAPENANSIFDPDRLQRMAEKLMTEHDEKVKEARETSANRSSKAFAEYKEQEKRSVISQNSDGQIFPSGGKDAGVFMQRVPSNQVSMTDDLTKSLEDLFIEKLQDNGVAIKEAAKERTEKIQGKKEADRSWDELKKPTSTSDMQKRLLELWIPSETEK